MASLAPDDVLPRLTGRFGRPYRYESETPSTQRLLDPDAPEGAVAVADHQTEGRGRLGRRWETPPATGVLVSVLLRPAAPAARLPELSIVGAEAVAEALTTVTGVKTAIKHPNDVLVGGRKIAGILGEAREESVVLGIGINVNVPREELPPETRLPATSVLAETGRPADRGEVLVAVLQSLERRYREWAWSLPGTTALVVSVPEAEALVGDLRRRRAATYGVPAHVTILTPFVPAGRLRAADEDAVRTIAASVRSFSFVLDSVARFERVLYLAPTPADPFAALTKAVVARYPDYPPYGGRVSSVIPHLTVAEGDPAPFDGLAKRLEPLLPIRAVASQIDLLVRDESGRFRPRAFYPLAPFDG